VTIAPTLVLSIVDRLFATAYRGSVEIATSALRSHTSELPRAKPKAGLSLSPCLADTVAEPQVPRLPNFKVCDVGSVAVRRNDLLFWVLRPSRPITTRTK